MAPTADRLEQQAIASRKDLVEEQVKPPQNFATPATAAPTPAPVVQPTRFVKVPKRGIYVSENGGVLYNTQGSSFINDEEAFQYRQEAVTEMLTSQAKAEQDRARLVGKPISLAEAIERVRTRDLGLNTNPVTGAVVARGDVKSERPLSKEEMNEVAYRRFPTLALQAQASGLTREEQADAISLPLATDAVRRVLNTRNPARQQQIINTMGPDMQALMIDIYNAWQAEAERNIAVSAEEDSGNVVTNAVGFVWDRSFGPIFDGLIWASEKGVQAGASIAWMSSGMSPEEAWEASQPGVLDPTMVDYARKTYGDITIDVILEARAASEAEDPNVAIAKLWDKYSTANDLDKLSILEQALSLSAYDQKTMDAITYLSTAETGNVGNIFSWSFNSLLGIDPLSEEGVQAAQSGIFSTTRNAVNVISLFAFDPFLVGGKLVGASKMYKYGLSQVDPANIDKAFQRPQVTRFFDTLGAGLTKADEAETPVEAAQIMNSLRSQYKNWLPAESLDALRWSGVRSGEDAAMFFKDAQYLELLTKGQMAKRSDQITIPHMVIASSLVKRASLVARGLTYDGNAAKNIDEIFGAGVSDLIPKEAIPVIIKKLAEPNGDKFVGRMLSNFVYAKDTVRRTFLGAIVGPLTKNASQYSRPAKAVSRYGYQRKRSPRARLERIARTQAHMPDMSAGLRIDDARDAFKVRDLMLYAGMPKYWADYSADLWKVMTPGQRKEFSSGIGRSVGYSLGVDIVDPVNGTKLINNIVSGARPGEMYSAEYIDAPILRTAIERQTKDLVDKEYGFAKSTIQGGDNIERPSFTFGRDDEVLFVGVDETFDSATSPKPVTQVQATPEGVLEEAAKRNPNDQKLQSMLTNIKNQEFGEDETKLLDSIIAAVAVDDAGKISQVEQVSGFPLVLSALSGNKKAQKILDKKLEVFYDNVEKTRQEKVLENIKNAGTPKAEPIQYDEIAFVRSSEYPFVKDAEGNVYLEPAGKYREDVPRSTIHFTINGEVESHLLGEWDKTNQLIVINGGKATKANNNPAALNPVDSWWSLSPGQKLELPGASVVSPYVDEAAYARQLEEKGLIKAGEKPPIFVEDAANKDVFYFSKPTENYTDADRIEILKLTDPVVAESKAYIKGLVGRENETLRKHALDVAMKQQGIASGVKMYDDRAMLFDTELVDAIRARGIQDGIYDGMHSWSESGKLEEGVRRIFKINDGAINNRFINSEIEAYRWIAARGIFKTESKTPSVMGSRINDSDNRVVDKVADTVANAPMRNPSLLDDGSSAALYDYQMTPIVSFPNMAALDQMSLRKSYLTMLLGDNGTMSTITDYWTLGTIAGPRFFLRNGLEDAGLYALTGGSWKGYRYGQLYSKASREATQRIDPKDPSRVRGRKLGLVPSTTRWFGDVLPKALNGIILPHLDEAEIALANKLAKTGDREPLTLLLRKAMLRQKLIFIKKPKNEQILKDLDEAAENPLFYNMMDEASETTEGLASGSMVGVGANQTTRAILNGEIQEVTGKALPYNTKIVVAEDPSSIKAWYNGITAVIYGDGKKVETPAFLREYYQAKMSGDFGKINDVVNRYTEHLLSANRKMIESSAIGATEGPASLARRKLDAALQTFTTKEGSFNDDLLDKLRREEVLEDGTTRVTYKMYDMVDGKQVQRVTEEDLVIMPGKPYSALGVDNMTLATSQKIPLSMQAWSAMGRSLARFTREPIFVANYLDARDFLRPIEKRLAEEFGEEHATKWAVENAYERAYATTMSYVDNPNVRSQLAWNVRNVARFYRAQEDFYRRMMRTVRNNPLAIQRLNLAWHALDETGFVHEDEFGDKYFVWPGNKATLTGINTVTSLFGINVLEGGALTEFTSKVSMLTPSADPNAAFPTLAGPWGATAFTGLMKIFPQLKSFQDEIMGEYSVGRSYWETVVPTNAKKSVDLFNIAFGLNDELDSDTVYADSARSAIQVYASTGLIEQGKQYTNTELADIKDNLNIAANDITILRTLAGPTLPAAVSVNPQTVTDFAKGMGVSGMRKVFIELLKLNDGDYSLAYSKFVKSNPGLSVFTVSENDNPDSFGNFQSTRETQKFIMENEELFKLSKTGSAFFAPQEGVQSLGAWKYLASMGAKAPKNVLTYFNEMVTAEGYGRYRLLQKQYYDGVDAGDKTVASKWSNAKIELYRDYPMLESRLQGDLSDGSTQNPADSRGDVEDIRTAVTWMKNNDKLDQRGLDAESVIGLYDQMSTRLVGLDQYDPMYAKNKKELKDTWGRVESAWSPKYEDDIQWKLLINATSSALGF